MDLSLIRKYNIPGPRYTSYPTVPFWDPSTFDTRSWLNDVRDTFEKDQEISLYIHLPFCEHLCVYCGCNTRITQNHQVEEKYIHTILKEWGMYLEVLKHPPVIREIHLGGGTPTFLSPANLEWLISAILVGTQKASAIEFSFEGHPMNTTEKHLQVLYRLGFSRVSFGIQDFDPTVQQLIKRIQPLEKVKEAIHNARKCGYRGINFDLIYGLPGQNLQTMEDTIRKTIGLQPDRIAFYSYAHVPHLKPAQNSYADHLPGEEEKRALYEAGKQLLIENGYYEIGMDHFALETDDLYQATLKKKLHRNFMGYSLQPTNLTIGLGVSAIGDTWRAFNQNVKSLEAYQEMVDHDEFPIHKGHRLNAQDLVLRRKILDLICQYETHWSPEEWELFSADINHQLLQQLSDDQLIELDQWGIKVTDKGQPFIRNICMAFDARLTRGRNKEVVFSKTI